MGKFFKNILAILIILALNGQFLINIGNAKNSAESYTTYKTVDKGSFNEYRYLITKVFFKIKSRWDVDGVLDSNSLNTLKLLAVKGFNYLPDNNLENENLLNNLNTAIAKSFKYSNSDAAYTGLIKAIGKYLDESAIKSISGEVTALPTSGNAPFNVTLRADVSDPTGTSIPKYNYTWWMNLGSRKINIGSGPSINYTFKEEGNFTVFVDIKSAHTNNKGYSDVIPFRGETQIKVKEKVASLIVKVNGDRLGNRDELKFTPAQAKFGLLFDATSSIPTGSARFIRTEWDFGNGTKKTYSKDPKIERVTYTKEGEYDVKLKLKTNLGKTIEREFIVSIHDPIATIDVSPKEGFLGDKFTFRAKNTTNDVNLTYNWTIVDIVNDEVVFSEQTKLFTYNFENKGHYNVKLLVNGIDTNNKNIDTKNIYINSRAPVAEFTGTIPELNKPNRILLDGTNSFDPDFTDTGKLNYYWEIDGARTTLEDSNANGSLGYYTFDSIGDHSVILEVEDPDNIKGVKKDKVNVKSLLSVDFSTNPRAIKRGDSIKFDATSPKAQFYEWDFGDGNKSTGGTEEKISHKYEKTGIFNVELKVIDETGKTNIHKKVVYVGNGIEPVAILKVGNSLNNNSMEKNACKGEDAYITDRISSIIFNAGDSIDIDGIASNLDYSLKIGNNKYFTSKNTTYKFDELGCFPIVLKVTSKTNKSTDTQRVWVKVKNIEPTLGKLVAKTESLETDPVIVSVEAVGAVDKDGVITSYLWYYYTDLDDEPQDFRSTTGASTTFVLPKITGNYYFVALLTDDSEARVSTKEIGKMSSLTLAGNNVNVPILELQTPDNSVHVGDEVILNAKVQNILKQNISKKVQYFWDFDGDGFYDLESKNSSVTHFYDKPGTFYAKLKVKYKGFSNTRNVEINVANSLVPKFDYVSIGNKFTFVNKTTGSYENFSFDLGDGTKIENEGYFEHTYTDGESSHIIKVTASDGNTVKTSNDVKVVKNITNLLQSKKANNGILLTSFDVDSENTIEIPKRQESITIFYSGKGGDFSEIGVDNDLNKDTDLNGGKDDDTDSISTEDKFINIELNNRRTQIVRVFVKDTDGKVLVSKDYKIVKTYLKEDDINLEELVFAGTTELEKKKILELKELVGSISGEDSRLSKLYVSKLKDEWNDENERTKIIYEFEGFLESSTIQNKDEIIEKLEDLLLKETDENNLKNVALRALQGLTPLNVVCEFDKENYDSCKDYINKTLEVIKNNNDEEQNKLLGSSILEIIGLDKTLTNEEKLSYKATLANLVYGGIENVPEDTKNEIIEDEEGGSIISGILMTILYIFLGIAGLFILGAIIYFVYYKVVNKNSDKDFKDFIEEKTDIKEDIFSDKKEENKDIFANDEPKKIIKEEITKVDNIEKKVETKPKIESKKTDAIFSGKSIKEEKIIENNLKEEKVPDWLKGSFEEAKIEKKEENKEIKTEKEIKKEVPNKEVPKKVKKEFKKVEEKNEAVETKVEDDNIPDWLKGSFEEIKTETKVEKKEEIKTEKEVPKKVKEEFKKVEEKKEVVNTKVEDDNIPDWLKGSFEETKIEKKEEKKEVKEEKKEEVKEEIKTEKEEKKEISKTKTKDINQKNKTEITTKDEKKVETKKQNKTTKEQKTEIKGKNIKEDLEIKTEEKKNISTDNESKKSLEKKPNTKKASDKKISENKKTDTKQVVESKSNDKKVADDKADTKKDPSDLWDDGMDVPDWLKS